MLTRKQYELLRFINERLKEAGVPPSFDEMKEALDLRSKSGIHRLITALEERGFIRRLPNRARAIEVIKLPELAAAGNGRRGFTPSVIEGTLGKAFGVIQLDQQLPPLHLHSVMHQHPSDNGPLIGLNDFGQAIRHDPALRDGDNVDTAHDRPYQHQHDKNGATPGEPARGKRWRRLDQCQCRWQELPVSGQALSGK